MRKPKLRELKEALRAIFTGPYTSKFPKEPAPAFPGYRGKGKFNEDICIGCTACSEVCPSKAIKVVDDVEAKPPVRRIVRHHDECIFCGSCHYYCTTGDGVVLTEEYDLSCLDRAEARVSIEKELYLCEHCGGPITTKDHIRWLSRKIGAKRFSNPTLIVALQRELGVAADEPSAPKGKVSADRDDIMRLLCPKCRREVVIREVWG